MWANYKTLKITVSENNIVRVSLNRPEKRNAIDSEMWKEIGRFFRSVDREGHGYRCILLTGEGKSFCAGIDISDESFGLVNLCHDLDVSRHYLSFRPKILEMQQCLTTIEECSIPVVAAIHGDCIGAGIDLVCCADIRICALSTRFSVREVRLGLAADVGTLQRFPKIVGHGSRVRELCFTGEDFDSIECYRIGFVSRISDSNESLLMEALSTCRLISANSPVAVSGTKISLNYSRDHSVREGLEHIAMHNAAALITDDVIAALQQKKGHTRILFENLYPHSKL